MRFHWPPWITDELDPDFLEELTARLNAEEEHKELERKRAERKRRRS